MRGFAGRFSRLLGVSVVGLALGACADAVTEPTLTSFDPSYQTLPATSRVRLAKIGPEGTSATFTISATGGTLPLGSTVTIAACVEGAPCSPPTVWTATGTEVVEVTITEVSSTGNTILERITVNISPDGGGFVIRDPTDPSVTVDVEPGNTVLVRFKNIDAPPPPAGRVRLAKRGPVGTTATFNISSTGGSLPLGSTVTLDACPDDDVTVCQSVEVWRATSTNPEQITITEVGHTGNLSLDRITVNSPIQGDFVIDSPVDPTVTVMGNGDMTVLVRFKNVELPPPPPTGVLRLAKLGPAGTTATFTISSTGGTRPLGSTVTLNACATIASCTPTVVWLPTDATAQSVTITETSSSGGTVLQSIHVVSDLEGTYTLNNPSSPSVTLQAGGDATVFAAFTNVLPPPPPPTPGTAGCTPGFWKQSQHFQYWTTPYTPSTQFSSVFANAFPGKTLLQVLDQGGGGLLALGRHTVAALLNGASPNVDYGMTAAQVIAAFNAAYASGNYTTLHNQLEDRNERQCTAKTSGNGGGGGNGGGNGKGNGRN